MEKLVNLFDTITKNVQHTPNTKSSGFYTTYGDTINTHNNTKKIELFGINIEGILL